MLPRSMPLPPLPRITLSLLDERERRGGEADAFVSVRMRRFVARYPDGSESAPFTYDTVERGRLDAVVVAPHFFRDGERWVFLRSAVRPPVATRPLAVRPVAEGDSLGQLWELPAGLVEADERSAEGLRRCAARELFEETGLTVAPEAMLPLGPSTFPAPGIVGERHFFFHAEVEPEGRAEPSEDGSALERHGVVVALRLSEALALARQGKLEDAKTELGLRRLAELS
jgi:ADP-ribose pyrophosphatase